MHQMNCKNSYVFFIDIISLYACALISALIQLFLTKCM